MARSALMALPIGVLWSALTLTVAACGPSAGEGRRDPDLAVTTSDGAGSDARGGEDLGFSGTLLQLVIDRVELPDGRGQYGIDDNGDGRDDNQLGVLLGAMATLGGGSGFTFMQSSQNLAITVDGSALSLLALRTSDPAVASDDHAELALYAGASQKLPELDGTGRFAVDPAGGTGRLGGALVQGGFVSEAPARRTVDVRGPLRLGFWSSRQATLPLHAVHASFDVSAGRITSGELHGVLTAADLQAVVAATLAADFTAIAARPDCAIDADCRSARRLLDLDGNGAVDVDEINQGPLGAALRPDVQMFDSMGRYAPSAANLERNAWSVGIAFTAAPARFVEP